MKRYYVEYYPNPDGELRRHIYLYAYSTEQIISMMEEYKLVAVEVHPID